LNLSFAPGELTDHERAGLDELRRDKYASGAWTRRL